MSAKALKNLRVVAHINKDDSGDKNDTVSSKNFESNKNGPVDQPPVPHNKNPEFDNMKAEVRIIDDKSLQLNLMTTEGNTGPFIYISDKMHFDRVYESTVDTIKPEFGIVMDMLLFKRKNGCIMHFATKQDMNIIQFFDLFISFLQKRLYHQNQKLKCVKLECLQIASSMQNTELDPTEKDLTTTTGSESDEDCDSSNEAALKSPRYAKHQFRTTRDLHLWLVNEYRNKFASGNGHEKLIFSFSITDHRKGVFKVKLSLFNIFLNLMHTEDRNHWQHYMDHVGEGCKGVDCDFMHSGLTLNLFKYIEGIKAGENTLLLFDVPTNNHMTADTIEILQMAHKVVKNRQRRFLSTKSDKKCPQDYEELKTFFASARRSSWPLFEKYDSDEETNMYDSKYSSEDFHTLSYWYRKIDYCFGKFLLMREKYIDFYFKNKNKQILLNIKNILKQLESSGIQQNTTDASHLPEGQKELNELFRSYSIVRNQFLKISQDIKNTDFEIILQVYVETKIFDLKKQAQASIRKHLKIFQDSLGFVFDDLYEKIELDLEF